MVFSLHLVGSLGVALRLCSSAFVMLLSLGSNGLFQTHSAWFCPCGSVLESDDKLKLIPDNVPDMLTYMLFLKKMLELHFNVQGWNFM